MLICVGWILHNFVFTMALFFISESDFGMTLPEASSMSVHWIARLPMAVAMVRNVVV